MTKSDKQEEIFNKIQKGLELTYQRLIAFKKQKNSVLVVIRDGKIVHLKPEEL